MSSNLATGNAVWNTLNQIQTFKQRTGTLKSWSQGNKKYIDIYTQNV